MAWQYDDEYQRWFNTLTGDISPTNPTQAAPQTFSTPTPVATGNQAGQISPEILQRLQNMMPPGMSINSLPPQALSQLANLSASGNLTWSQFNQLTGQDVDTGPGFISDQGGVSQGGALAPMGGTRPEFGLSAPDSGTASPAGQLAPATPAFDRSQWSPIYSGDSLAGYSNNATGQQLSSDQWFNMINTGNAQGIPQGIQSILSNPDLTEAQRVQQLVNFQVPTNNAGPTGEIQSGTMPLGYDGLAAVMNAGQFSISDPTLAEQVGQAIAAEQNIGDSDPLTSLVGGADIHLGNLAQMYIDNPQMGLTAGAFGPVGSSLEASLWNVENEPSDQFGRPSEGTVQEIQASGIDSNPYQAANDLGLLIGAGAAVSGLGAAAGANTGVGAAPSGAPASVSEGGVTTGGAGTGSTPVTDPGFTVDPITGDTVNTPTEPSPFPTTPGSETPPPPAPSTSPPPVAPVPNSSSNNTTPVVTNPGGGSGITPGGSPLSDLLGGIIGGGIGLAGANRMAEAYERIANQEDARIREMMGFGANSRRRFEDSFNPNFDIMSIPGLRGAMDNAMQSQMRALSTQGNPFGNPGGLMEAQNWVAGNLALPAFQNYQAINSGAGGLTQYAGGAAAGPNLGPAMGAVNAQGQGLAALGTGLGRGLSGLLQGGLT